MAVRFCPTCGNLVPESLRSCDRCSAVVPPGRRRRIDYLNLAIVGAVCGIIVLAVALVVPVSHSYAHTFRYAGFGMSDQNLSFPAGSTVSGSWSVAPPGIAFIEILGEPIPVYQVSNPTPCPGLNENCGSTGSFSFTADSPTSTFDIYDSQSPGSIYVSGTYKSPIL